MTDLMPAAQRARTCSHRLATAAVRSYK